MSSGLEEFGVVDDEAPIPVNKAAETESAQVSGRAIHRDAEAMRAVIAQVPLFSGLLPAHRERISRLAKEVVFDKGEVIFHHGDEGDGLYIILEGAVRISRNTSGLGEEALAVLHKGEHFGEMSMIDDDLPRSADAICNEESRLLRLPKNDMRDLMFVDRELAYELLWRFVRTLAHHLRDSNDRLMMLTATSKF